MKTHDEVIELLRELLPVFEQAVIGEPTYIDEEIIENGKLLLARLDEERQREQEQGVAMRRVIGFSYLVFVSFCGVILGAVLGHYLGALAPWLYTWAF